VQVAAQKEGNAIPCDRLNPSLPSRFADVPRQCQLEHVVRSPDSVAETQDARSRWQEVIARSQIPLLLVQISTRRIIGKSKPAETMVGSTDSVYGLTGDREQTRKRLDLLDHGVIDGYQFRADLIDHTGATFSADFDVQRVGNPGAEDLAIVMVSPHDRGRSGDRAAAMAAMREAIPSAELDVPILVGTVDQDWRISRLSNDVAEVLGRDPTSLIGVPFTTWVHRDDLGNLLIAMGRAFEDGESVTVVIRVGHENGTWVPLNAIIIPLAGRAPPEFAFIARLTRDSADPEGQNTAAERLAALEHRLWRIALELRAAGIVQQVRHMPDLSGLPRINELSARQLEVLTRLLDGERVPNIATEMFISPSTVRNHLAAIYRKVGVHSQAELLAYVRNLNEANQA
jgi:DNA-binding CsgD family transcriptional regulator